MQTILNQTDMNRIETREHVRKNHTIQTGEKRFPLMWVMVLGLIIFATGLALHFAGTRHVNLDTARNRSVFLDETLDQYRKEVLGGSFDKTFLSIDENIDRAFEPVYENIPKVVDQHYTLKGQYVQLLTNAITDTLFSGTEQRFNDAQNRINKSFENELSSKTGRFIRENTTMFSVDRNLLSHVLNHARQDTIKRFKSPGLAASRIAATGLGATIGGYIAVKIITKIGTSRWIGTKSSAAVGACIGAPFGPAGIAIGGAVGAIVGWVISDTVILKLDEYFNRENFEAEIRNIIDEEKNRLKAEVKEDYRNILTEIKQLTPKEIVEASFRN